MKQRRKAFHEDLLPRSGGSAMRLDGGREGYSQSDQHFTVEREQWSHEGDDSAEVGVEGCYVQRNGKQNHSVGYRSRN